MSSKDVVTDSMLTLARAGDEQAFRALTDPYRRELQLHCYRMLGSSHDAEDALQRLPARQRSVLVLRDVLGFRAAEVADMLDASEATVESALQRARSALDARLAPAQARAPAPRSRSERELAESFADAFEEGDM